MSAAGTRRTWTRAGRNEFVNAAVAYLEQTSTSGGDSRNAGQPARTTTRATDDLPPELGIRLVASLVGKSPSAPLFHFPDRLSLQAAVAAEGFRRLATHLAATSESLLRRDETALDTMMAMALSYVEWASDHAALFSVMYTPALAAGVDAIQCAYEGFWHVTTGGHTSDATATTASQKRRLAFEELYAAKAGTLASIVACVKHARAAGVLAHDETNASITFAMVAMADGLAWQRITEPQLTPRHMRQHARRSLTLLLKGIGVR
jgi:AcrR family transcriptional regulator